MRTGPAVGNRRSAFDHRRLSAVCGRRSTIDGSRPTAVGSRSRRCRSSALFVAVACAAALLRAGAPDLASLGKPEVIAPGVELYRLADPALLSPPGPVAVQLLRLDPGRVDVRLALAQDTVLGLETVPDMARRAGAAAAINAGFFLPTGEPAGLLKIQGELVSETNLHRGAVALVPGRFAHAARLLFDQVSARVELDVGRGKARGTVKVDAVDTVRGPGALVLFTPRFWTDTQTPCDGGTELVLDGRPLAVADRRDRLCASAIPRAGGVLAAGPKVPGERLNGLVPGRTVRMRAVYDTLNGSRPSDWDTAPDIVGGVGLLAVGGRMLGDWQAESARAGFSTERHPRTMIGNGADGRVWLITVDGRNPAISVGMNFSELQALARRVGLVDALNLDGGGSTTMVVRGAVVNHPSDPTGPRRVSDAIVVRTR